MSPESDPSSPEPGPGREQRAAHDVLAAEAFAVPAADPALRQRPLVLPEDPSGIAEPHDVLAAEEFAMPALGPTASRGGGLRRRSAPWLVLGALGGLLLAARRRARR
jgi:hypothetical protein